MDVGLRESVIPSFVGFATLTNVGWASRWLRGHFGFADLATTLKPGEAQGCFRWWVRAYCGAARMQGQCRRKSVDRDRPVTPHIHSTSYCDAYLRNVSKRISLVGTQKDINQ